MDTYVLENAIRRGKKGNGQKGEMNSGSSGETKGRRETEEGGGEGERLRDIHILAAGGGKRRGKEKRKVRLKNRFERK